MAKNKQRFLEVDGADVPAALHEIESDRSTLSGTTSPKVRPEKLREEKTKVRDTRRAKRVAAKAKAAKGPDWEFIERGRAKGSPAVTFSPSAERREHWVEILKRRPRDTDRKRLLRLLGDEFARTYKRYRRQVQPGWEMLDKESKHARQGAMLCILKSVTPRQLIEYWHAHVGEFTGMKFPSLSFLVAPGNVDRVSAEVAVEGPKPKTRAERESPRIHAYSDTTELDAKIRPGLTAAGFDMNVFSDRQLLTVQSTARAIAQGHDMFVSSKLKPMVTWVVENLYRAD
jgi:hypothetical protein